MSTLFVSIGTLTSGGAERVLSVLSTPLADSFNRVVFFVWRSCPVFYKIDPRVDIIDIEKKTGSKCLIKKMWWFRKYIIRNRPNVLLSFLYPWSMKVISSLLFTKTKIVVAERIDARVVRGGWPVRLIRDLLYLRADGILVQTKDNESRYFYPLRKKIHTIFNPVNMPKGYHGMALDSSKVNQIVTVGRLHQQKNHSMLIRAFSDFYKTHPYYQLIIYGEGDKRSEIEKLIEHLNLKSAVILPGSRSDIFEHIKNAKLFILSSDYEGMPNALLEAMCLGLPCISTKVSGAVDLIKHGENGLLVNVGDQNGLLGAIYSLIDNTDLAAKMARNATKIYEQVRLEEVSKKWISYLSQYDDINTKY